MSEADIAAFVQEYADQYDFYPKIGLKYISHTSTELHSSILFLLLQVSKFNLIPNTLITHIDV